MGELSKDPKTGTESIIQHCEAIRAVVNAEGITRTIRLIQYTIEDMARETKPANPSKAEKYTAAAELLDDPYNRIKDEIGL